MITCISSHALRAEGDDVVMRCESEQLISIHALRAEGDHSSLTLNSREMDFYPRPPCGGRPNVASTPTIVDTDFYPRPPCGGRPLSTGDV